MVDAARAGGRAIPELWPLGTEALALAMEVSVLEAKRLGHRAVLRLSWLLLVASVALSTLLQVAVAPTQPGRLPDRRRIEAAKTATGGDCRAQTAHLVAALRKRSVDEVLAWDHIHGDLMAESYRRDLWGAAYLINGGCSDDGFDYFRGWLLAQGQAVWQAALADPDSLADHPEVRVHRPYQDFYVYLECEDILGVAYHAYEALTGQELTVEVAGMRPRPPELGEDWDFDDAAEMRTRYPRLWAICGWDEASSAPP